MKKLSFLLIIILNLLSAIAWGEDFSVNYYHKGAVVYTQQVAEGTAIGSFPTLTLTSCNDEINIFIGWIAETDIANYQSTSTTTPTYITEDYIPTSNTNLYALFADSQETPETTWQQVKSKSELKDNDQIIIAANNYNYAIGKTFKNNQLVAIEIIKSEDKSTITPNNDVQIFTLEKISNILWGIHCKDGYLGNMETKEYAKYYNAIKDWSSWGFTFDATTYSVLIANQYNNHNYPYLYYNVNSKYFACSKTEKYNLAIYKQTTNPIINYTICTTPDAVEYTIKLHDGETTSEIKCMSNEAIESLEGAQTVDYWQFYGWATALVNNTTTAPEIITFPYTPTGDIDLYAVYSNTTADSLKMTNKTIPATWTVNETRNYNTIINLLSRNYIKTPIIDNITNIEIDAQNEDSQDYSLCVSTKSDSVYQNLSGDYKTYNIKLNKPTTTPIKITYTTTNKTQGVAIRNITIHHSPIYSSSIEQDLRHTIRLLSNTENDTTKHYAISQSHDKGVKLPKNTFTNGALNFLEWNTSADGEGEKYENEAAIENITADLTLYAQWGTVETVESDATLNIKNETTINRLIIKADTKGKSGEIQIDEKAQLRITDKTTIEKEIDNTRYHFFSLPFDCNITNIEAITKNGEKLAYAINNTEGDWVICCYDQTTAANNAGNSGTSAWREILDTNYTLKANQGYIVGYFIDDEKITLKFSTKAPHTITTPQDKEYNLGDDYIWYTDGENISANGWNLIGQPFYETMTEGTLTTFVTIPNSDGKTYTQCQYYEALQQEKITPFSAFFVQLEENKAPTIRTTKLDYALYDGKAPNYAHIYLSDGDKTDRTTIINHSQLTAEYEIGYDLKKWIGYAEHPQIYTIEKGLPLAYNSQNINETSVLTIGMYAPTEREYTFSANENCPDIYLTDKATNTITNLSQSDYTTHLPQGTIDDRFEITFQQTTSTQPIASNTKIEYFVQNRTLWIKNLPQNSTIYIYDCAGKMIDKTKLDHYTLPSKSLYHIIIMQNDIKIDNFDVIY